jgi:hypothetical protein
MSMAISWEVVDEVLNRDVRSMKLWQSRSLAMALRLSSAAQLKQLVPNSLLALLDKNIQAMTHDNDFQIASHQISPPRVSGFTAHQTG